MEVERARALLASLAPVDHTIESEVGCRQHVAHLRMHRTSAPERWLVVHTSGVTYTSVEFEGEWLGAPGRLSLDEFHEDHTDDEVELCLRSYRDIALAYLDGSPEVVRSGRFGSPAVMLETTEGPVTFKRSVAADVGSLLRFRGRGGAARPRR